MDPATKLLITGIFALVIMVTIGIIQIVKPELFWRNWWSTGYPTPKYLSRVKLSGVFFIIGGIFIFAVFIWVIISTKSILGS